ncbi:MAG: hypothetical protein K2H53_02905, partial [Clostridia bacterium]|nr:hypothetical protein [Clostridia bacterium]
MEKTENPKVKEYLIDITSQKLDSCEIFAKVFGEGFARGTLESNLNKVYTNGGKEDFESYYDYKDKSVTICNEGEELITPKDIQNDKKLKRITTHEGIHAIFPYLHKELGKGATEGLCNWIMTKAGISTKNFERLTKIVNILELAVGEENVMRLGKGDIEANIPSQLQMTKEECVETFKILNGIYYLEKETECIEDIVNVLMEYRDRDNLNLEEKTQVEKDYEELKNNSLYLGFLDNTEEYLILEGKEDTLDQRIVY